MNACTPGGIGFKDSTPQEPGHLVEPPCGWREGMERLLHGRCPWCGNQIVGIFLDPEDGLTWSCLEGCNP